MKKAFIGFVMAVLVAVGAIGTVNVVSQSHGSQSAGWSTPQPTG